jgi:hypothetical protein
MPALRTCLLTLAIASMCTVPPVHAHHAFAAEFDINQPVTLTGRITRLEWTNPHAWLFIDVPDNQAAPGDWAIELVGTNDLLRLGWGRSRVQDGDEVSISGYRARNGSNTVNAASVTITATGELLWESAVRRNRP